MSRPAPTVLAIFAVQGTQVTSRPPPRVSTAERYRMRANSCDTLGWCCVQYVLHWPTFPSVPALRSTNFAADRSVLFVSFKATMTESDFSGPFIIGYGRVGRWRVADVE